ncbi:MAG: antitoxin MazE family protein [Xanthobacteraceae bacterium]
MASAPKRKRLRKPKLSRVKAREHRDRLRSLGLRPIRIWVPDVHGSAFRSQAHRQSLAVAASADAREDQAFVDAIADRKGG